MNTVFLQVWEESNKLEGLRQDGCSIHIDKKSLENYIKSIYKDRKEDNLPDSYERIVGDYSEVEVSDSLYSAVVRDKTIRLRSYEMNNLLNLSEIIVNE